MVTTRESSSLNGVGVNTQTQHDFLGEVLASLQVASSAVTFFEFSSPWSIKVEHEFPISCTVVEGCLWLTHSDKPSELYHPGDTFILPRGASSKSYFISSSNEQKKDWITVKDMWERGHFQSFGTGDVVGPQKVEWGGGGADKARILSFAFNWEDQCYGPLIESLPEFIRVNANGGGKTLLDMLIRFPFEEGHPDLPGFGVLIAQTAQLFLVHAMRTYAINIGEDRTGWLRGFSDPKLAQALAAIHKEPSKKWSVEGLAQVAGMSRSVFAKRFTTVMGEPPMDYLCEWRMHLARLSLARGDTTITALAFSLGYQSEAAFRTAFRKVTGENPREYSKRIRQA